MIALLDCNNFFVSCERAFRPDLRGRPVAVLSGNDGCIVARSDEVKSAGIPMGAPVFKWREEVREHGVKLFSSNFHLYSDMSWRVMNLVNQYVEDMQVYSVDEAFFELSDMSEPEATELCRFVKKEVYKKVGIPVSIGIGTTKTLAKVANQIAKNDFRRGENKYGGVFNLCECAEPDELLKLFPVGEIWGIGRKTATFLNQNYIYSVTELRDAPATWVRNCLGLPGVLKQRELQGLPASKIRQKDSARKGIMSSRSFGRRVTEYEVIWDAVSSHVSHVAEKLRRQHSLTTEIRVYLYVVVPKEEKVRRRKSVSHAVTLPSPTNLTPDLLKAARGCLKQLYVPGREYKKAGVVVSTLLPDHNVQLSLAQDPKEQIQRSEKFTKFMEVSDLLKDSYGGIVDFGRSSLNKTWTSKCEIRSPRYTTNWDEILTISDILL